MSLNTVQIEKDIITFLRENPLSSSPEIHKGISRGSYATVKRMITKLLGNNQIVSEGNARATRYQISQTNQLLNHIDMGSYFEKEIDERVIQEGFNFQLIREPLTKISVYTSEESNELHLLLEEFRDNVAHMSPDLYDKEMERLAIDLSWKSSQIDSFEYKKAMLIFYEQNNISVFQKTFIEQFKFAVKTYF